MDNQVDLRHYVEILFGRWYLLLAAAAIGGLLGYLITLFLSPTFETSTTVVIAEPVDIARLEERLPDPEPSLPFETVPRLAVSGAVLQEVQAGLNDQDIPLTRLRSRLAVSTAGDARLLELTARAPTAEEAAEVANLWADVLVAQVNLLYGEALVAPAGLYRDRLETAAAAVATAEENLAEYEQNNRARILETRLAGALERQATEEATLGNLVALEAKIEQLQSQLADRTEADTVALADQLTALLLQLETYDARPESPFQLVLDEATTITVEDPQEQMAWLEGLQTAVGEQVADVQERLAEVESSVLQIQGELSGARATYDALVRERDTAVETYSAVALKVQESEIETDAAERVARALGSAPLPEEPAGPDTVLIAALGALLGFFGTLTFLLIRVWWRQMEEPTP